MNQMYEQLLAQEKQLAVIGLGYVGLPVALAFAEHCKVVGFDINQQHIDLLNQHIDPNNELPASAFEHKNITFTHKPSDLHEANFFVVAVPTPVDEHKVPDLRALTSASKTVANVLKKGDYVVFESTVYPGCTEEDCLPILESISGLKVGTDFKLGYSPERINPGDMQHSLTNVVKVASGCDAESLENIAKTYELIVTAGVHRAPSIKVAEASKVIENTQRDLNIALMNELSVIFDRMDINTHDVLTAAGTKWNFLKFYPGLVGGHCIGVDPYYLTYKSAELGYKPEVILSGRRVNDNMPVFIAKKLIQMLIKMDKRLNRSKVLVKGVTFKEDVSDLRNSKVIDLVKELQSFQINVDVVDPHASNEMLHHEYELQLTAKENLAEHYDAVIVAVKHKEYLDTTEADFIQMMPENGILFDIKGIYRQDFKQITYWTL